MKIGSPMMNIKTLEKDQPFFGGGLFGLIVVRGCKAEV